MSSLRPPPAYRVTTAPGCCVAFGAHETGRRTLAGVPALQVALPLLGGEGTERVLDAIEGVSTQRDFTLFQSADSLAGFALAPAAQDLEAATRALYEQMFAATLGLPLIRIWNYVPRINAVEHGLENYRRFCRGRSLAFEQRFGRTFQRELPAASAVGTPGGALALAFLASHAAARHFENPRQVPAFEYPIDYGPRPPSFSRATRVETETLRRIFISGTAAIRGHATVAADDLEAQLACTRENLHLIAQAAGAGAELGAADGWQRSFKVYVRHRSEAAAVRRFLEQHLLQPGDDVIYLLADLCRVDLCVEIEAVLSDER